MSTATLLIVAGGVVLVKTLALVAFVVRRGRRQRAELDVAAAALASAPAAGVPAAGDPTGWRLQWAEPGVLLLENTSGEAAAREVTLSATLTASSGAAASVQRAVRFVGTGASFTARFADLERWLADTANATFAALDALEADREPALRRLACTLSYSMAWLTPEGERRRESRLAHTVVPVPDLIPGLA